MVAEALALVAIGWFVPTIFAKVHELAASFASGIYKQYRGQQEKFERLADLLQSTKKGMEELAGSAGAAASSRSDNEVVWRFKDAVDDADDLLAALLKEDAADAKVMKGGRNYMGTLFGSSNPEPLTKLDRLLEDLKGIRDSLQQRLPQPQPRGGGSPARTSAAGQPAPPSDGLCGYSGQYTALRSGLLLEGQGQHHQVIAVIGHGGTGKTALASWAFHRDEEVQANFDLLIWVDVHAKFRATDLLREMCKSAARSAHRSDVVVGERDDDVTSLKQKLKDILQHHQDDDDGGGGGKKKQKKKKQQQKKKKKTRYLLVLDDVCNDESAASEHSKSTAWATALDPFKQYGHSTSKILITTRPEICATRLGAAEPPIVLDGIDHNDMKLLIEKTTFGTRGPPDWWCSNRNARALSHNVAMLCGSPQLAEAFGKRLQGEIRSPADKMTRDREMRDIMRDEIPLVVCETHFSSYQSLPPHLQRCLALCSLFPNRWGFEKDKLVKMWVSLGFVVEDHPSETGKSEGRAGGYFDDLRKRGLFQKQKATGKVSGESRYEIYEHIHSMLRTMVCRNYFLSIDDGGGDGPKECDLFMARHLAVTTTKGSVEKLLKKLAMAKKLRTLIVFQHNGAAAAAAMLDEKMLKRLEGLRVMDLSYTTISEVPGTIGMLKQARYLGLPRTVGKMSSQVTKLSLVRYLDMPMEHIARIAGIGSLQMLQGSVEFHVLKTKDGHSMRELEELDSLRETLSIKGLEAVKTKEEAEGGHLERKRHLEVLKLEWGHRPELQRQAKGRSSSSPDSIVLAGLQPHHNLQELYITRYQGKAMPLWMADGSGLQNLRSLHLRYCSKLLELPPVGDLPHLQVLEVKGMSSLEWIDGTFCSSGPFESLERLLLSDMPALLGWDWEWEAGAGAADHHQLDMGRRATPPPMLFPQLSKVEIIDCPKLSILSGLLTCRDSLSVLRVKGCPAVRATLKSSIFPSLRMGTTDIHNCPGLKVQLQE